METFTKRLAIVIPVNVKLISNNLSKNIDTEGGERTFTVPLAKNTKPNTITHYWCSWQMTQEQFDAIQNKFSGDKLYNAAQFTPEKVLEQLGLVRYINEL